jgi:hypothetical protein
MMTPQGLPLRALRARPRRLRSLSRPHAGPASRPRPIELSPLRLPPSRAVPRGSRTLVGPGTLSATRLTGESTSPSHLLLTDQPNMTSSLLAPILRNRIRRRTPPHLLLTDQSNMTSSLLELILRNLIRDTHEHGVLEAERAVRGRAARCADSRAGSCAKCASASFQLRRGRSPRDEREPRPSHRAARPRAGCSAAKRVAEGGASTHVRWLGATTQQRSSEVPERASRGVPERDGSRAVPFPALTRAFSFTGTAPGRTSDRQGRRRCCRRRRSRPAPTDRCSSAAPRSSRSPD